MRLTNHHGLPQTILNAIDRDPYDMGPARMSVTGLLAPPRIGLLRKKHAPDIETDASDMIWSLLGRGVHSILEQGGDEEHLAEERLYAEVRGWRISGALDLQRIGEKSVRIVDYKTCSSYAVLNQKSGWSEQLNCYSFLCREAKGWAVESLAVCAIIRDWSRHKAREDADYPQAPVVMISIEVWEPEVAKSFVEERVRIHQEAIALADMQEEPPLCTDEERWMRPASWAVYRTGNKRPTKVFANEHDSAEFMCGKESTHRVECRPGEPIRCSENFCQVAPWCRQHAEWQRGKP